ncbi:hypothetical protein SAMN04487897_101161 [Paenibacillus sp. yr247]|uniref:hypothetical protein n=1 Tax=Paenibacillus sp. yr247 TaxID=1761880 RepID=UPI000882EB78|nr:hypothetical protein [Paenibacillus sp. yr247]SDM82305.1 hypothetical protein SAMN04487897_101161 [Paenibacillus sp. yr247]
MKKVLNIIWGLFVDDARLAITLVISLAASALVSKMGYPFIGTICLWAGLLLALFISIEHQLFLKLQSKNK